MNILIIVALIFAVIEWIGEHAGKPIFIYCSKPFVMISLICWVLTHVTFSNLGKNDVMFPIVWFIIGLVLCLVGDVFLMFPERYFMPGLVFFLIGHGSYIMGFGNLVPPLLLVMNFISQRLQKYYRQPIIPL